MASRRALRVFVSHATADTEWCAKFVTQLEIGGVDVWWDVTGMRVGLLATQIERELQGRSIFVPVLSPSIYGGGNDASRYRPWLELEYNMAVTLRNRQRDERDIIPVVASNCDIPPMFDAFIGARSSSGLSPVDAAKEVLRLFGLNRSNRHIGSSLSVPRRSEDAEILGRSLLAQERYDDALHVFETLQRRAKSYHNKPKEGAAWFGIGRALHDLEHYEEALTAFTNAQYFAPNDARGWGGRGTLLCQLLKSEEALDDLNKATSIDPNYYPVWFNKSNVLRTLGRLDESLDAANCGVKLAPMDGAGYAIQAAAFQALGRTDEALAALEKALTLSGASPASMATTPKRWQDTALVRKAQMLLDCGYPKTALMLYEQVLEHDQDNINAWCGAGNVNYRLQEYEKSLLAYEHAINLIGKTTQLPGIQGEKEEIISKAWEGKAFALTKLRRFNEAHQALEQALENQLKRSSAFVGLGELYSAEGRFSEASEAFQAAADQGGGGVADALNSAAAALMYARQYKDALPLLDRAITVSNGTAPRPWLNKIEALTRLKWTNQIHSVEVAMAQSLSRAAITSIIQS